MHKKVVVNGSGRHFSYEVNEPSTTELDNMKKVKTLKILIKILTFK